MFKTLRNAFKIKDIRAKLLFTLIALLIVRLGCLIPVPGVDRDYFQLWLDSTMGDNLGFLDALTGGSFTEMSIFALNISPYITSSIIMQLLTIAIPKLEELQKDGEEGRKKIAEISRYLTIGLAIIESVAMTIGFNNTNGVLRSGSLFTNIVVITVSFTAGSAFLMWLGERITEKGVGNGISMILLFNIVAKMPSDISNLVERFVTGAGSVSHRDYDRPDCAVAGCTEKNFRAVCEKGAGSEHGWRAVFLYPVKGKYSGRYSGYLCSVPVAVPDYHLFFLRCVWGAFHIMAQDFVYVRPEALV